jgi:acetyltransferase-like isoleucine patch superfamily enzyme
MKLVDLLINLTGKTIDVDPLMPTGFLIGEINWRGWALLRGLLLTRSKAFIKRGVIIRGPALKLGEFSTLDQYVSINSYAKSGVSIGARSKIGAYSVISATNSLLAFGEGVRIGDDCGIGQFSFIGATGGVTIGNNVIMGQYVSFHASNHVFDKKNVSIREQGITAKGIEIGDNVWVGAKATFLDGSNVGSGSIVAAGAVVSGTFPPMSVLGGVPAKILRKI